jgi:anaerobic selenocysteine-containing dehydrogenase
MSLQNTFCRLCDSRCGLQAEVVNDRLVTLMADRDDPVGAGFICETATHSIDAMTDATRITEPMKRVSGHLQPVGWDQAIDEIGTALRQIRGQSGPDAIGLYMGAGVQRSTRNLVRGLAFGVGSGTRNIFSELCMGAGPRLWIAERMIGHPAPLLADVSRAHYVLLLSGEQRDLGWGPVEAGMGHEAWIQHSRRTKKTKVIVADPRTTELSKTMDGHLPIRPGTEPYLMLGMLHAIVTGGWVDTQFIEDYTEGYAHLKTAIAPWTVDRCAALCGIEADTLSGVALKFSRSAMSVIQPAAHSFSNQAGALGAWAWMAIHAVTANLLRPGGLYESRGAIDLFPVLTQMPTSRAPTTQITGHPLMLMQAPATAMPAEIAGETVQALITVGGNPAGRLPDPERTTEALRALSLLVCIGSTEDETAREADWVLPAAHPWEQASLCLHDNVMLPFKGTMWSAPLVEPRGEARPEESILADLFAALRPGLRKSAWGTHIGLLARHLATTDLAQWENRAIDWADDLDLEAVPEGTRRIVLGDSDRSTWRPSTDDGRVQLAPEAVCLRLSRHEPSQVTGMVLRTAQARDRAPDTIHRTDPGDAVEARVHPEAGFEDGARAQLSTAHGTIMVRVCHDEALRPGVVDVPFVEGSPTLKLLDPEALDPWTGVPTRDGLAVELNAITG